MAFPEVYGALESKAVDGQENPLAVIQTSKFNEVQKYLSLTRHVYTAMPVLMSKKTWDSMSATERRIIQESEQEARTEQRKISLREESKTLDALRKLMQVNEVAPAEVQRLRQKVQPVIDKYTKEVGEPVFKEVTAELARLRAAK
jgi:TRAP-type C4-dicarboxylate transport system substrate-binding protein